MKRVFLLAVLCLCCPPAWSEIPVKDIPAVWGSAVMSAGMTDAQAKRGALNDARAKAVEEAAGVRVDASSLYSSGLERAHFLQTLSHGYIVEEEVLAWVLDSYQKAPTDAPIPRYRVRLRARVAVPPPPENPGFAVTARLNRTAFAAGEAATLELTASRDAWLYVVNITADDTATLLLPNRWQPQHRYTAKGKPLVFPAPECGVCLDMQPLPDDPETAEAFLVLGFAEKPALEAALTAGRPYPLAEFYRKLTAFPLHQAALQVVPYTVRAKPEP